MKNTTKLLAMTGLILGLQTATPSSAKAHEFLHYHNGKPYNTAAKHYEHRHKKHEKRRDKRTYKRDHDHDRRYIYYTPPRHHWYHKRHRQYVRPHHYHGDNVISFSFNLKD